MIVIRKDSTLFNHVIEWKAENDSNKQQNQNISKSIHRNPNQTNLFIKSVNQVLNLLAESPELFWDL